MLGHAFACWASSGTLCLCFLTSGTGAWQIAAKADSTYVGYRLGPSASSSHFAEKVAGDERSVTSLNNRAVVLQPFPHDPKGTDSFLSSTFHEISSTLSVESLADRISAGSSRRLQDAPDEKDTKLVDDTPSVVTEDPKDKDSTPTGDQVPVEEPDVPDPPPSPPTANSDPSPPSPPVLAPSQPQALPPSSSTPSPPKPSPPLPSESPDDVPVSNPKPSPVPTVPNPVAAPVNSPNQDEPKESSPAIPPPKPAAPPPNSQALAPAKEAPPPAARPAPPLQSAPAPVTAPPPTRANLPPRSAPTPVAGGRQRGFIPGPLKAPPPIVSRAPLDTPPSQTIPPRTNLKSTPSNKSAETPTTAPQPKEAPERSPSPSPKPDSEAPMESVSKKEPVQEEEEAPDPPAPVPTVIETPVKSPADGGPADVDYEEQQEEYDKSGKPLNAAAVRQVQRAKSERKRKRSTVWIAVCMVSLVASFSCIVAVWMWRRRHAEKRESEGGFSYHNPTADLGDRYFSAQHSGSDFGSTPGTGKMMSKSGRGKSPPIMIYDNSYLTTPGETASKPFFGNSGLHTSFPRNKSFPHRQASIASSSSSRDSFHDKTPPLPASTSVWSRQQRSAGVYSGGSIGTVSRDQVRGQHWSRNAHTGTGTAPSLPLGMPSSFMRSAHKPGPLSRAHPSAVTRGMDGMSRATTVLTGGLTQAVESPYQPIDTSLLDESNARGEAQAEESFDINDSVLC